MEKSTITIEIKQEVSILLLWIVGGIIFVSIAFFIPSSSTELWPQFYTAGVAAIVYLIALLIYAVRKPVSIKARVITMVGFALILTSLVFTSIQTDLQAHWQINKMIEIRSVIKRGITMFELPQPLLETLQAFHQQGMAKKENLDQMFRRLNKNSILWETKAKYGLYKFDYNKGYFKNTYIDTTFHKYRIFITKLKSDSIVLVAQENRDNGRSAQFKNYNGMEGIIQEKCTLTAKGIKYESEN